MLLVLRERERKKKGTFVICSFNVFNARHVVPKELLAGTENPGCCCETCLVPSFVFEEVLAVTETAGAYH